MIANLKNGRRRRQFRLILGNMMCVCVLFIILDRRFGVFFCSQKDKRTFVGAEPVCCCCCCRCCSLFIRHLFSFFSLLPFVFFHPFIEDCTLYSSVCRPLSGHCRCCCCCCRRCVSLSLCVLFQVELLLLQVQQQPSPSPSPR